MIIPKSAQPFFFPGESMEFAGGIQAQNMWGTVVLAVWAQEGSRGGSGRVCS